MNCGNVNVTVPSASADSLQNRQTDIFNNTNTSRSVCANRGDDGANDTLFGKTGTLFLYLILTTASEY